MIPKNLSKLAYAKLMSHFSKIMGCTWVKNLRYVKCACPTNLHFICRSASSLKVACLFQVMLNLHVTRMELIRNV